jgi:hypothetical protein
MAYGDGSGRPAQSRWVDERDYVKGSCQVRIGLALDHSAVIPTAIAQAKK